MRADQSAAEKQLFAQRSENELSYTLAKHSGHMSTAKHDSLPLVISF